MKRWFYVIAFVLVGLTLPIRADVGSSLKGSGGSISTINGLSGGTLTSNTELRDPTLLAAESLTNGALTAGTSWTQTADFALAANAATYTHATGAGSFQQTSAAAAIPWASVGINGWFSFTYTTSAVTGTPVCTIPNTFALASTPLTVTAGTYTVVFQAMATMVGNFQVSCTSGAAATVTFDTLSLKQVNGGTLTVPRILAGSGTAALPGYSFTAFPSSGFGIHAGGAIQFVYTGTSGLTFNGNLSPTVSDTPDLGATSTLYRNFFLARSIQGSKTKNLTESSATAFVQVGLPAANVAGGKLKYCITAVDAAAGFQNRCAEIGWSAFNDAGAETCAMNPTAPAETNDGNAAAIKAGTLTYAITCDGVPTNGIQFYANAVSSLTQTVLRIDYRLDLLTPQAVTPQ